MYCKFSNINGENKPVYQIGRFDGNGCFMEVIASMAYLEKPKFILRFIKYDNNAKAGKKYTADISIYLKYDDADALSSMILSSYFERVKARNKKEGLNFIYKNLGGTSAENLAKQKRSRVDGLCESRQFSIEEGQKVPYVFKAQIGPGNIDKDGKGLIVPAGKPEQYILIGFDEENIVRFARDIQRKVAAMDVFEEGVFQKQLKQYSEKTNSNKTI